MKLSKFIDPLSIKAGLLAALALGGCIATTYPLIKTETAQRIAAPAWMIKRDISASPFVLRAYERIHDRGGTAHLYIEGDGDINGGIDTTLESNPTPDNPLALHLASKDKAENVIYLARPCQYVTMMADGQKCDPKYWGDDKYSSTVIKAYDKAMDEISRRYNIKAFEVIGYSGGGAIATLLAAERPDILSVRTVAGILDHETHQSISGKQKLQNSMNPARQASRLTKMPQYHFVGGQDNTVPPAVLHSYLQNMPPTRCVQTMLIQEAEHENGWVNKWPELLELPVTCYNKEIKDYNIDPSDAHMISPERPIKP